MITNPAEVTQVDFDTLAPQIIDEVAKALMPDRPIFHENDREIRFGNKGSFNVNKREGTFYDFESDTGGGILDMIAHVERLENRRQAFQWLRNHGFLEGLFTSTQHSRPRPQPRTRQTIDTGFFKLGLELWKESEPIPFSQSHPVRRWCGHRNLFPSHKELPPTIRYHQKNGYIIVAMSSLKDFINAYPDPPTPRQFHLIAIDRQGNKRTAFKAGGDKRIFGQSDVTCVALFGDPHADEIAIAEGIADTLSLTSDFQCVIASITTFSKIANDETLVNHLSSKAVYLCGDNDEAGKEAERKLAKAIGRRGGEIFFIPEPMAKDPAEAARRAQKRNNERN